MRALQAHPAFSITNPNRIRALVGSFAGGNQTQFNRADGAGYDFVADFVLDLDKRNPQTAARLLRQLPLLAGAGAGTPRAGRGGAPPHRGRAGALAGHARHHHPDAGLATPDRFMPAERIRPNQR